MYRDTIARSATYGARIAVVIGSCFGWTCDAFAQPVDALSGQVASVQEGPMEGVIVSARRAGSTVTVSVVSDADGRYRFPTDRLAAGRHELTIRASGYALVGAPAIETVSGQQSKVDLQLQPSPVTADQLTNAEWLASASGEDETKRHLLNCTDCHTLQRIFGSQHTKQEFLTVFERMAGYYPGASDLQPQRLVGNDRRPPLPAEVEAHVAEWLASVNLNGREAHPFAYQTYARPMGRATRVIITEWDLPRPEIQPHDVIVDQDGMAWFGHFGEQFLTRLDPQTGKTTDYAIPVQRPGWPVGTLDTEFDADGRIWVGLMYQTGLARFDRAAEAFTIFPLPKELLTSSTQQSHFSVAGLGADGRAWVRNSDRSQVMRLDVASGQYENLGTQTNPTTKRPISYYGIYADQQNNAYIMEFASGGVGRMDAKGAPFRFYPTPTPNARARRGRVDDHGRMWFAEYGGNAIAMLDPAAEKITEWPMQFPWEAPYDVVAARNGDVWEVNEASDRVGRLNPTTGEIVEYLLPRRANIRRVFVEDRAGRPAVWFGNNSGAAVIRLEPLD